MTNAQGHHIERPAEATESWQNNGSVEPQLVHFGTDASPVIATAYSFIAGMERSRRRHLSA